MRGQVGEPLGLSAAKRNSMTRFCPSRSLVAQALQQGRRVGRGTLSLQERYPSRTTFAGGCAAAVRGARGW